jgi:hypothetical protein
MLPAVVIVLAATLSGMAAATASLRAHDVAADAARLLARGESPDRVSAHVSTATPGALLQVSRAGDLVCTTVTVVPRVLGAPVPVHGKSCALDGGR